MGCSTSRDVRLTSLYEEKILGQRCLLECSWKRAVRRWTICLIKGMSSQNVNTIAMTACRPKRRSSRDVKASQNDYVIEMFAFQT